MVSCRPHIGRIISLKAWEWGQELEGLRMGAGVWRPENGARNLKHVSKNRSLKAREWDQELKSLRTGPEAWRPDNGVRSLKSCKWDQESEGLRKEQEAWSLKSGPKVWKWDQEPGVSNLPLFICYYEQFGQIAKNIVLTIFYYNAWKIKVNCIFYWK